MFENGSFFYTDININFLKVYCYINTLLDKHFCTNQTCNLMIKVYKTNMGTLSFSHNYLYRDTANTKSTHTESKQIPTFS